MVADIAKLSTVQRVPAGETFAAAAVVAAPTLPRVADARAVPRTAEARAVPRVAEARAADNQAEPASELPTPQDLQATAQRLNDAARLFNHGIRFEVNDQTGDLVIRVVDQTTNQVIRSIPSEEALELSGRIEKFLGIMFDAVM